MEWILMWTFLLIAAISTDAGWAVAAGMFAIAGYMGMFAVSFEEYSEEEEEK